MNGFVIVGTDTDAGKTTFSLLLLTALGERFEYWKPVESGEPDSARVRKLVPGVCVHEALARFREPVAPALAAEREGRHMPGVAEILQALPRTSRPLIIETFGGPLSPLTHDVLQIELIRALQSPVILVSSSAVGAVGRTLAAMRAMEDYQVVPEFVVLLGPEDPFAAEQIARHGQKTRVLSFPRPEGEWTSEALRTIVSGTPETWKVFAREQSAEARTSPGSANLVMRDRAVAWHPYTSLADPADPLPVASADHEFLHLADGRSLIDAVSSWWTILHGHRHPPLIHALRSALDTLDHVLFAGVTHEPAIALAELLLGSTPWRNGRVFYSDNGSTAVEVALKMAYQFWCHRGEPQRTLFVGFENGYHGDTFGAMAIGRDPLFFGHFEPLLFKAIQVPVSAATLDDALAAHSGEVSAVIIEPLVQGAGGMRMHSAEELRALFEVAQQHNVLFIADEVMTGCRTGRLWAHQHADLEPDLICCAKTLTGGMLPLAATLASPRIVAAFQTLDRARTFFHGHSFTANPLACAVAAANWQSLQDGRWLEESRRIESFWHARLEPLRKMPGVKDVRVRGTIAAVELESSGGYLAEVGPSIRRLAIDRGVLLRPLGPVVYAMPPLCTSNESLERIVQAMTAGIASL
jgi:adenosylmethionine-8-amino-7-oxononanoate aminotransferase